MSVKHELNYKDVSLIPQKSIVASRKECGTGVTLGSMPFKMPVYPANMKSVVDANTCEFLASNGWFYTMHRFGVNTLSFARHMREKNLPLSVSTGINLSELNLLHYHGIYPEYITVDVANAWSVLVQPIVKEIKKMYPDTFLIVGNVATIPAVLDLIEWGADAIKVGIAGGHVCITKDKTGFHRPMVSTILDCARVSTVPIIADGGISTHGDIAKALAAGATMVMAGSLFAGYDESSGDIIEIEGRRYKEYFGSASEYNKPHQRNIEGKKILVDYKGPMSRLLQELQEDLQSSISYAGGRNLSIFNPKLLLEIK
jgi:GMP reductase